MLKLDNVQAAYGHIKALNGLSLEVAEGEIVCLIGVNGAGKTTTLRTITGGLTATGGSIDFMGRRLIGKRISQIVRMGISCVPEGRKVFATMTVEDNLEIGGFVRRNDKQWIREVMDRIYAIFPILKERRQQLAGTLSGGEQQMLALGRSLMSKPKLMLLDEPSMGLAPVMVERTFEAIETIRKEGTTILLVEQNARMALLIADRGYVLQSGKIVLGGTAAELQADDSVRQAYLGITVKKEPS
ncbi:MAG: ABC transporter ATP-binding protein [Planctomycetes bacterium]|nr:ABC transporter ATP-binding protein [Planctomycetota bacterium]